MRSNLLYSRWGYTDGCIIGQISDFERDPKYDRIFFYKNSIKHIKCDIYYHKNKIVFDHYSTITGLRKAELTLPQSRTAKILIFCSWNLKTNSLTILIDNTNPFSINAIQTNSQVNFDDNGVPPIIDPAVMTYRAITFEGEEIHPTPAIVSWKNVINNVNMLVASIKNIDPDKRHVVGFEIIKSCFEKIVTGFEVYLKSRFIELEDFLGFDYHKLIKYVSQNLKPKIIAELNSLYLRRSKLRYLVPKYSSVFNFQDFDKSKELYKKFYKLSFFEIPNLDRKLIDDVKGTLLLRHSITHSDHVTSVLNIEDESKTKIIDENYLNNAVQQMNEFILKIDEFSIELISSNQKYRFNF
ncbi:MAG TPA: hypothetical protein VFU67_00740 [Nitrososphaeraceae archaeon]|nr:hypothetical protein [Nitrososphaeraceae archaeon]